MNKEKITELKTLLRDFSDNAINYSRETRDEAIGLAREIEVAMDSLDTDAANIISFFSNLS